MQETCDMLTECVPNTQHSCPQKGFLYGASQVALLSFVACYL